MITLGNGSDDTRARFGVSTQSEKRGKVSTAGGTDLRSIAEYE